MSKSKRQNAYITGYYEKESEDKIEKLVNENNDLKNNLYEKENKIKKLNATMDYLNGEVNKLLKIERGFLFI